MSNPIANADQRAAECDVVGMWQTDVVRQARTLIAHRFALAYARDTPDEARPGFDAAIDEYLTNYLFKAAGSDVAHPRFVRDFMPAYRWDGRDVPGARMGGDNPDNCYRLAGIAHGGRYRVTGRPTGPQPAQTSFTLTANYGTSVTVHTIESEQLRIEPDGSFVLTIDGDAANGRANHLTTQPHVKFLFIRESFEDWSTECSYDLAIERLDPAGAPRLTLDEMAAAGAFRAVEEVPLYYWFQRLFTGLPVNSFRPPASSAALGGLVTQAGVQGWYQLEPDQAVLLRYQPAGAAYVSTGLADFWFRSLDAHRRQSSLTRAQSVVDADGCISAVIARRDPGVANWLDAGDARTVLFFVRWQGLPPEPVNGGPMVEARVIALADISDAMRTTQAIDAAARLTALAARRAAWDRRTS